MKKIFAVIGLALVMALTLDAQNIAISPGTPVQTLSFRADSIKATDTNWVAFYAPYTMNVLAVQVVASAVDTGQAGTGAGSFKLYKYGTSTAIVQDSMSAAHSVKSKSPSSSTTAKLAKGYIYKISWTITDAARLDDVIMLLHYTQ